MMSFSREIQRLLLGLLSVFGIVMLGATYWAVIGADTILLRTDNPRLFEAQAGIVRGDIVDRHNTVLVTSIINPNGRVSREFRDASMNSILGYYSLRYGVGGAEAAYNALLRGDNLPRDISTYLSQDLLHRPQRGSDVRLSLDLITQQATANALAFYTGAAVVLAVPSGEVLALVSLPTFDPNQLDSEWEVLTQSPAQPFFNRVLQGRYQPGGILQTPLITAAILADLPLDIPTEGASQPVDLNGLTLTCARHPPADRLTLGEAYAFGCPAPFATLYDSLGVDQTQAIFDLYQLGIPYQLLGFNNMQTSSDTLTPTPITLANTQIAQASRDNILGQGALTLSPLDVAIMTAAIVNDGNAPQPAILLATRPPNSQTWQPANTFRPTIPITTAETSQQLRVLMRNATINGSATRAARSGMNIGGHAAVAYAGDKTLAWFTGFVVTGARQGIAVALVLEDVANPQEAASIGGQILKTAFERSLNAISPN